ncbi:MAG: class II aldolase/adducin family protein [Bacteroidetes bacterium]|nr:class II aldolase/adducin family protein [Bacteroidota bacterium]
MSLRDEKEAFLANVESIKAGYRSWGDVSIQDIVLRDSLPAQDAKLYQAIFAAKKSVQCIMVTRQEYGSALREEVPPILDDQAQLLGVSIRIARDNGIAAVIRALNNRYAAVLPDGRCICIGGTVEDAYIAAQLLEKTAKAWTEAKYLGGAKSINRFEAWAMQMYYQFKYAKEAKKNR